MESTLCCDDVLYTFSSEMRYSSVWLIFGSVIELIQGSRVPLQSLTLFNRIEGILDLLLW
jgi:hypothetical protein